MFTKKLDDITATDLEQLITLNASETRTLEFKRQLNIDHKSEKLEFAKDICALANADGGDIVFGIEEGEKKTELEGCAVALMAMDLSGFDTLKMLLRQVLERYIEPRVFGVDFGSVEVVGGYVLIVRVPRSYYGPHCVYNDQDNKKRRFVFRNGEYTSDMSYEQLRTAFDRSSSVNQHIRQFRGERLSAINEGLGLPTLCKGPYMIVHLIPYVAMEGRVSLDIASLVERADFQFNAIVNNTSKRANFEGLLQLDTQRVEDEEVLESAVQVFRSGSFEAVLLQGSLPPAERAVGSYFLSRDLRNTLKVFIENTRQLEFLGPAAVAVTLKGFANIPFMIEGGIPGMIKRDDVLKFPEQFIEDLGQVEAIDSVVQPILDMVWQAFGLTRCALYDESGVWQGEG